MIDSYSEYKNLQDNTPVISSEELLFIKEVINMYELIKLFRNGDNKLREIDKNQK